MTWTPDRPRSRLSRGMFREVNTEVMLEPEDGGKGSTVACHQSLSGNKNGLVGS